MPERFGDAYVVAAAAEGAIAGVAGVEKYGRFGLLRSVAVAPAKQGRGLGQQLTRNRIDWSRAQGIDSLYLLTTTAPAFFGRQGFREVSRLAVPIEIRTAREFTDLCPDSAT
ncbi:MAG: GNAT family N-acetyltransferase, partial [Acidobacteria bacterium]|nr:GNAT family N-acetyltransferase [Acidobacteriota bacterium]